MLFIKDTYICNDIIFRWFWLASLVFFVIINVLAEFE